MPSHPERVRTASLPAGYQFGDAGKVDFMLSAVPVGRTGLSIRFVKQWRPPHLNAAERLRPAKDPE